LLMTLSTNAGHKRVIFSCLVVNSNNSPTAQSASYNTRHRGTNLIGSFASCKTVVKVKSSETEPRHFPVTSSFSNKSLRMAVDPPQQKFLSVACPRAEVIDAFQTERSRAASETARQVNQR